MSRRSDNSAKGVDADQTTARVFLELGAKGNQRNLYRSDLKKSLVLSEWPSRCVCRAASRKSAYLRGFHGSNASRRRSRTRRDAGDAKESFDQGEL